MPSKPLVTAGIESLLNTLPYHSPALKTARSRLLGRILRMEIKGFSTLLILVLSERQVDVLGEWAGDADCTVIAYVNVLSKLYDRQQPTALIRSGGLEVQGDIQVVQNFIVLADPAEFDPTELLAPYTDDTAAEEISKAMRGGAKFLHRGTKRQQCYVAEAITEEWCMASGPPEVVWFAEEMAAAERAVDALTKRLERLEAK